MLKTFYFQRLCAKKIRIQFISFTSIKCIRARNWKKKRPSLTSMIIDGLKRKKIIFDNNYKLYKDFLPVELLCQYIDKLILKKASGTFNVGSGIPILVSDYVRRTINLKALN